MSEGDLESDLDQESRARAIALRLLNSAPRSRAVLEQALERKSISASIATRVLDRFTEVGLIDDAVYADILVRTRHQERGLVGRALQVELQRKGIDEATAQIALAQVSLEDEYERASALAARKLAATSALEQQVRMRRTMALLARKGYSPGLAMRVVREQLALPEGQHLDLESAYDSL